MKNRILASLCVVACLGSAAQAQQSQLAAARDLYASARYDEALSLLNGLPGGDSPDRKSIEQYRSLCLLALGRGSEAERAIAAVVTVDPLFVPGEAEASPRVRAAFSEVRHRLLPEIAASRYGVAKAAFDRQDYAVAEPRFRELLTLLNDPQMGTRLADLRVLAKGFLDLTVAAATPPPEPVKANPLPSAPAPAAVAADHIWSADAPGVTPAVTIKQTVPRVPIAISKHTRDRGLLEVVIDEQGRVIGVTLRTSIHPVYDPLLMAAARQWTYQPATVNGVPVRFRKLVQIIVDRQ
ncbi:MAG: energy transducer TonB [Acidobacteriota bacterium]|nr:energy transducer TonB [Acidobacteriota bacterium]